MVQLLPSCGAWYLECYLKERGSVLILAMFLRTATSVQQVSDMYVVNCRYLRLRDLRSGLAAACLLGLRVRILPGAWIYVCCECCVCYQVQVSASGWSLVQRSPTECDREASIMRRLGPSRGCRAMGGGGTRLINCTGKAVAVEWGYAYTFTHSELWWLVGFTPWTFSPRERACAAHWIGGWVALSVTGRFGEKKNPLPLIYVCMCVCMYGLYNVYVYVCVKHYLFCGQWDFNAGEIRR
jgi:hypothetical protein